MEDQIVVNMKAWQDIKRKPEEIGSLQLKVKDLEKQLQDLKGDENVLSENNLEHLKEGVEKLGKNLEAVSQGKAPEEDENLTTMPKRETGSGSTTNF